MTHRVAVLGAGLMGCGIAQLMAASGQRVAVFEPFEAVRQHAAGRIEEISRTIGRLSVLGPMMNADLVGLELTQDAHREVFPQLCNDELPNPVLQKMLDNGHTGMRGGKGFYDWTPESAARVHADLANHLFEVTSNEP